jgi:hypothetical protein
LSGRCCRVFNQTTLLRKPGRRVVRPVLYEGFVGVSFCVGVGLRRWRGTPEMQKPGGGCGPDTPCSHAEKY